MDEEWWPDLLSHIPAEDPWQDSDVVVADLRSYDDPWLPGSRVLWSALVPTAQLEALKGNLIAFDYEVESTGRPMAGPDVAGSVHPRFWISAVHGDQRLECEPLILGWENHNQTAMMLDPGFAATYGLIPRALADGSLRWDNPAAPEFDVAVVDPPSIYDDCRQSGARAVISRDYLQDYLTLRGMELVQVYWEIRRGPDDAAIEALLGDKMQINAKLRTREVDVRRRHEGGYIAQIWGARHVAGPGPLPITSNPLEINGLKWPGIDIPVTQAVAQRYRPWDHVYVRDTVLGVYEGRPGFHVSPETGGVGFGNQWGVGPAARVGRDVIRLEVRKLYEGTPHRVIQHWHAHAVEPTTDLLGNAGRSAPNVATRARSLVLSIADIGLALCGIAAMFGLPAFGTSDYVGLDKVWLEPNGWWNGPHVGPITHHIPADMPRADFLSRCLDLNKLINEPLSQKRLRPLVKAFGQPHDKIDSFGGLKLLDRIVCLSQVAVDSGLVPWEAGDEIVARYAADGTDPAQPLDRLFALNDLRQVAGHRKEEVDELVAGALARFGLDPSAARGGWAPLMDQVYDQLAAQLAQIHATLIAVLRIEGGLN